MKVTTPPRIVWPGGPITWDVNRVLHVSIPFTWNLPTVLGQLQQGSLFYDSVVIGGPAVDLMPDFISLPNVGRGSSCLGVLQRVNPQATRTTKGCPNKCPFCIVPKIEGSLVELDDWPDLPVICDNNLLAASMRHFDRVVDRLMRHGWACFNQGLDARLLTDYHAMRLVEIADPMIYLALDNFKHRDNWLCAYDRLRSAGILKRQIRSYALVGYKTDPGEAWKRCEWVEKYGVLVLPQWFHALDQTEKNIVTKQQTEYGWTDYERRKIMQWFYQHKRAVE
jgi:hypothetical protein